MSAHEEREAIARELDEHSADLAGDGWMFLPGHFTALAARVRALPVADDAAGVKRVKVDPHMLAQLGADWSRPVQIKVDHEDRDGDLVLVCKSLPTAPDDAAELAALREAVGRMQQLQAPRDADEAYVGVVDAARALLAKRDGQGVG